MLMTSDVLPSIPQRVRALLPAFRARKSLGQHLLTSRAVLDRIVAAAEVSGDDWVVEVGPGLGALTNELALRAGKTVAVELDDALAAALSQATSDLPNVTVVHDDARTADLEALAPPGGGPYKVVANLPYYAALPIMRRFLEAPRKPGLMVVMVQREVAEAMTAKPGDMSLVSVAVQLYGAPRLACRVPPGAFAPPPKVASAVVRIDVRPRPAADIPDEETFFRVVRAGFSAPRKQVRNSLAQGLGLDRERAAALLTDAGLDPRQRPEDLDIDAWARLAWAHARRHDRVPNP